MFQAILKAIRLARAMKDLKGSGVSPPPGQPPQVDLVGSTLMQEEPDRWGSILGQVQQGRTLLKDPLNEIERQLLMRRMRGLF